MAMLQSSPVAEQPTAVGNSGHRGAALIRRYGAAALIVGLAFALWLPRLTGPLDLRFDAGVYYILGTSLAAGDGYRLLNEPGAPEAVQYPPLLPLLVAAHQWVLGTSDPPTVASALRGTFFVLFLAYAWAVLQLARRFLPTVPAIAASALCLLSVHTYFLSDLLFAEIPFALVGVGFALVATSPWTFGSLRRETTLYALGVIAFLLRTAGIALFAAWIFEALVQRRWRSVLLRTSLALLPFALWQGHIIRVQRSDDYQQPAYAYQRAPYQFYNVSYSTNVALKDPFVPERGRADIRDLVARVAKNSIEVLQPLAETTGLQQGYWRRPIGRVLYRLTPWRFEVGPLAWTPVIAVGVLLLGGIGLLFVRRAWLIGGLIVASVGLVCLTPWPDQFHRYLSPLAPFLTIALLTAMLTVDGFISRRWTRWRSAGRIVLSGLVVATLLAQLWTVRRLFQVRAQSGESFVWSRHPGDRHLFFHGNDWRNWERAAYWIRDNTPPDAIIATTSPHLMYLATGRLSVMPPMEADPLKTRNLMESVPIGYVVVDELKFLDVSRRHALPAIKAAPGQWRLVHAIDATEVYAFDPTGERHAVVERQLQPERPMGSPQP
jgi:hypothetical protein